MTNQGKDSRAALLERAIRLKRAAAKSPSLPARPAASAARLGELQRSLWLLQRLEPTSPAYNLANAFWVKGQLEADRLQRGLDAVLQRHRILRSTFEAQPNGDVLQVIHPPTAGKIEHVSAPQGRALEIATREARRPFDLGEGPLLRLLLIEESPGETLLLLVLHHILADEKSLGFLWRDLARAYDGTLSADEASIQYDDFVHWQASRDDERKLEELDFWRRRLDPLPETLQLPFERQLAAPTEGKSGTLLGRSLAPQLAADVQRLASADDTTPFIVFLLAYRLLLQRYTEDRDIAVATPASQRSHPATATMVGYFLNAVVLPITISEEQTVQQALRHFNAEVREFMGHASVSLDVLVETLEPPRQHDRHPLFQTMFVYQETPQPPTLGDAQLEPQILDLGESKFDLTLFVSRAGEELEIAVEYRRDRFDEHWMLGLLDHYTTLIEHLVGDSTRQLLDLPLLSPVAVEQLQRNAQGPELDATHSPLLPQQIVDRAASSPNAPALISSREAWTYEQLERESRQVAHRLLRGGVERGDRVGLFLDRSPQMIAGLLGCLRIGAAYVPLDPAYPAQRNHDVLADADVAAILTRAALGDQLTGISAKMIDLDTPVIDAAEIPSPEVDDEDPAYLLYTSGSSGKPKGVVIRHANLRASNEARKRVYGHRQDRFLLVPSIAFDSSVAGIFGTLATGGALVIPSPNAARDPRRLAQLISKEQVTNTLLVPSLYELLLRLGGEQLSSLEVVIVAGESCPPPLVEEHFRQLPEARLFNEYGPTEATVWATVHEIAPSDAKRLSIPIGRPIPGVRVEVLDPRGRRVPPGIPGEGWIVGPTLAQGYWQRPETTAERFVDREGTRMYRTGDRLAWTEDARLLFLGRTDRQIKLRGVRIEPGEVEAALCTDPAIEEAAVVLHRDEELVAYVAPNSGSPDLMAELGRRLPQFMVPQRLIQLDELPRLPNGKVDRAQLHSRQLEVRVESAEEPRDEREQALVALWEGLLKQKGVSPLDNFFQLGGHSLLTVEMAHAIEQDFGVALTPAEVFQHPTIRRLAALIERGAPETPAYSHLFPVQPGGHGLPFFFAIPHFFSSMIAEHFRGERPVYGLRGVGLRPEGNRGRWPTMRELGEELVDEIQRRFGDQPCDLAGYSFGATMAVETARLMEERGHPARCLYLIAPMPLDVYHVGPLQFQLDALRRPLEELSAAQAATLFARQNHPLRRRPYQRLWRLLALQTWRRVLCRVGQLRQMTGRPLTPRILHADVRLERFRLHAAYRPGPLQTPTVFFNAREPATDAAATWRPYFAGPFEVHEIPDPHLGESSVAAAQELILGYLRGVEPC